MFSPNSRYAVLGAALLLAGICSAESVFNGSFELGTEGFAVVRDLRPDTNRNLQFLPLSTGPAAPGSGTLSLKLENPYEEDYFLHSKEFPLPANRTFVFSGKVRSTAPDEKILIALMNVDPKWTVKARSIKAGPEWKKFSITMKTGAKAGYFHIFARPFKPGTVKKTTLFFDDFSVVPAGGDAAAPMVQAVAVPEKTLYTAGEDKNVTILLKFFQPGSTPYSGTVTVTGKDEYTGETRFARNVPVTLASGERKECSLEVPAGKFGGVRISIAGKGVYAHDGFFAVIGRHTPGKVDVTKDFVVAFNDGLNYTLPPTSEHPAYKVFNAPFGKNIELLAQAGCRLLRDHDAGVRGVDWVAVEPEPGKFDFTHLDRMLDLYEKNRIVSFPILAGCFAERFQAWQQPRFPEWVKPLCERVKKDSPWSMKKVRGRILLPPDREFSSYIRETVRHIGKRVPAYEVTNEPNFFLWPRDYAHYLKIAYAETHRANPAATVVGICLSSDFNAKVNTWQNKCIETGALNDVDAVSVHPYGSRELNSTRPADRTIAEFRRQLTKGGALPLWNTELYYLIDQRVKHNSFEETLCRPHHAAWRFLVDLGEGVVQSIALPGNYLWKRMLTPNMKSNGNFHELIPSENFVVYNALARFFEGAKPEKKFRCPNGVICYVYRKDGQLVAAVWNYQKRKEIYADLSRFEVFDLFGNPESSGEKRLCDAPFYLKPGKCSEAEFLSALEKLAVRLDRPVSVTTLTRKVGATWYVTLHNDSARPQTGVVGLSGKAPVRFSLAPGESRVLAIPLRSDAAVTGKTVRLMLSCLGRDFPIPVEVVENREIGKTFSFGNATGTLNFGPEGISLSLSVKDTTDAGKAGKRQPWETDCVELFFDLAPLMLDKSHPESYTANVFRLFVRPRDGMKLSGMGSAVKASDCKISGTCTPKGYTFALTVPVKCGSVLGFDAKIDDSDGKTMRESSLSGRPELFQNRTFFNIAMQKDTTK